MTEDQSRAWKRILGLAAQHSEGTVEIESRLLLAVAAMIEAQELRIKELERQRAEWLNAVYEATEDDNPKETVI